MKIKSVMVLTVITVSMLLFACAAPSQQAQVEISCDEFSENPHISKTLEVQDGGTFEVKLCSNPTTGFQWLENAQVSDAIVLIQENHEFIGPESEPSAPVGAPGQEVWTFKALEQGSADIYLEYGRPWEGGEKGEWTCTVNVVVK